jgi:hypothetical protein
MIRTTTLWAWVCAAALATPALAQTATTEAARDAAQQQRIEGGLQSGALSTHEAGRLEREQAGVAHLQAHANADGTLTSVESARIKAAQDRASRSIATQKHDAQTGNPASASSRRMQADVARNRNQQARIAQGTKSGSLDSTEMATLERAQSRTDRAEARAASDGQVGAVGQARIQGRDDVQSARIHKHKHD